MNCPSCDNHLTEITSNGIKLDICRDGCGGIWFDRFELQKMDQKQESVDESLFHIPHQENLIVDPAKRRRCPRCHEVVMMRHYYSIRREIEVDECGGCGGFWLDFAELEKIRNLFDSTEEEQELTRKFFANQFNQEIAALEAQSISELQYARKFANLFRLICPSFWIPGKQRGAAF